jgi:amidase
MRGRKCRLRIASHLRRPFLLSIGNGLGERDRLAYAEELDFQGYVKALGRRASICREWQLFMERYPLLLMPVSCEKPFPVDFDQEGDAAVKRMLTAHHTMLAVSMLGLPGLSVPTGLADGIPVGVQLVSGRFQEDLCLAAGQVIEARKPLVTPIDPSA